jgi:S1-C subfamily serine protease
VKYGTVQRAYLGIQYPRENLSEEIKEQNGIKEGEGVYVLDVPKDGAAYAAGIKKGDIITKINGVSVYSGPDMVGQIATYRPGDKVSISFVRDGKEQTTSVTLRNSTGTMDVVRTSVIDKLGAELQTINKEMAKELGINGGVVIRSIGGSGLLSKVRVQEGFVILKADNKNISSVEDLRKALDAATGPVKIEGIYPGYEGVYNFMLNVTGK